MTHPALLTMPRYSFPVDDALKLKPDGLITASSSLQSTGGSAGLIVDVGEGFSEGVIVFEITVLTATAGNAVVLYLQGTVSDATFGTDTNIVELLATGALGDVAARETDANAADDALPSGETVLRLVIPYRNEKFGNLYRYLRLYHRVISSGTINYRAWLVPRVGKIG